MGIVQDIGHILLPVDDMEKALAFYRDLLGFRVVGKGSPVWTVIETKGGQLTLWRTSEIPKVALGPKGDSSPFEFHVENFEAAASTLESKGIRVRRSGAHAGTIWDPFGNVLRVHDHVE
ncbi:MAG TPA: VOC family protein [Thermoplasmata archaeon]|nr:VOC family protein [Thermoplasmata archaeon]